MTRITKTIAQDTALKLTQAKKDLVTALEKKLTESIDNWQIEQTPPDVMRFFDIYPQYTKTDSYAYISGAGISPNKYGACYYTSRLPSHSTALKLPTKQAIEYVKLRNDIEDAKTDYLLLYNEIVNALIALGTYAKVAVEFPEAYEILPPVKVNTALIINIQSIKNKLK